MRDCDRRIRRQEDPGARGIASASAGAAKTCSRPEGDVTCAIMRLADMDIRNRRPQRVAEALRHVLPNGRA